MKARSATRGPLLDPIRLIGLAAADGSELRAGGSYDAQSFDGCDLSGRDLTGIGFLECEFRGVSLDDATLRGASVAECVAVELHAAVLKAPRSSWRDVRIERSRLGSVELYESDLRSVQIDGSKLDFVNLRNSKLTDVLFSKCIIEELDLGSVVAQRVELRGCRIGTLDLSSATLKHVDLRGAEFSVIRGLDGLRGATIDESQLSLLAPLLAGHLGIVVE